MLSGHLKSSTERDIMQLPSGADAETALADARSASTWLAAGRDWLRRYLLAFAAGSFVVVLLFGLGGRTGIIVGLTLWILLISGMSWWGNNQRVVLRGHKRRSLWAFATWGVLYGVAILVGILVFRDEALFWVPAAALSSIPLVVGALWPPSPNETRALGTPPNADRP